MDPIGLAEGRGFLAQAGGVGTLQAIQSEDLCGVRHAIKVGRTDLHEAGRTDGIDDTINYRTLTKQVIELVEESSYFLVEKMAVEISRLGLEFSESIERIRVSVEKPGAVRFARSVGVTIERTRDDL